MTFAAIVALCITVVHHQFPVPRFDAYVDADDPTSLHEFTTAEQDFAFKKCLAMNGHQMIDAHEDGDRP